MWICEITKPLTPAEARINALDDQARRLRDQAKQARAQKRVRKAQADLARAQAPSPPSLAV